MDGVKWTVDLDELPQPVEVSRSMYASNDFNTGDFLLSISDFRTLKDVHNVVAYWESRLHKELQTTVNENFDEFVKSAASISNGRDVIANVHAATEEFASLAEKTGEQLAEHSAAIQNELNHHKQLAKQECLALKALHMFDLLAELETAVVEADPQQSDVLISLARMYVAIASIADELKNVKAVQMKEVTIRSLGDEIRGLLMQVKDPNSKLAVAEALSFMND